MRSAQKVGGAVVLGMDVKAAAVVRCGVGISRAGDTHLSRSDSLSHSWVGVAEGRGRESAEQAGAGREGSSSSSSGGNQNTAERGVLARALLSTLPQAR